MANVKDDVVGRYYLGPKNIKIKIKSMGYNNIFHTHLVATAVTIKKNRFCGFRSPSSLSQEHGKPAP